MKTKNLIIIFTIFLLITLVSGGVFFFTRRENLQAGEPSLAAVEPDANPAPEEIQPEKVSPTIKKVAPTDPPTLAAATPTNTEESFSAEQIRVTLVVNGQNLPAEIELGSTVYDLMARLKQEKKIDFQGKNYADLGFFVEQINGLKNNPAGENWVYYINSQPAPMGISYYILKINDLIEWKYEKKSF